MPLFPRYVVNSSGDEWPTQQRLLKVRDWLREQPLCPRAGAQGRAGRRHLAAHLGLSQPRRHAAPACAVCAAGKRRHHGVFQPRDAHHGRAALRHRQSLHSLRRFLSRELARRAQPVAAQPGRSIVARHQAAVERQDPAKPRSGGKSAPIDDINQQQQHMEMRSTPSSVICCPTPREEYGKITPEGRFRIWKEAWLLDYLGIARPVSVSEGLTEWASEEAKKVFALGSGGLSNRRRVSRWA